MKNTVFVILLSVIIMSTYVDYGMSYNAIQSGRYYEANKFASWYVDHPVLAIPIISIGNYGGGYALNGLHKDSPAIAWILVGGILVLKSFVLIHNLKVLR